MIEPGLDLSGPAKTICSRAAMQWLSRS